MPYWDHKRRRRKNCVSFFCDPYSPPSHCVTAPVGHGERIPRTPFGRFAPSLVAFSASFWSLHESVISMILTVWRL